MSQFEFQPNRFAYLAPHAIDEAMGDALMEDPRVQEAIKWASQNGYKIKIGNGDEQTEYFDEDTFFIRFSGQYRPSDNDIIEKGDPPNNAHYQKLFKEALDWASAQVITD